MLLIFSDQCNDNDYIRREVTVAGELGKDIIPLGIEEANPRKALRMRLSDLHWIDGFRSQENAINELVRILTPTTIVETAAAASENSLRGATHYFGIAGRQPASSAAAPSMLAERMLLILEKS